MREDYVCPSLPSSEVSEEWEGEPSNEEKGVWQALFPPTPLHCFFCAMTLLGATQAMDVHRLRVLLACVRYGSSDIQRI